jgi:cytochrome c biogenesis protein
MRSIVRPLASTRLTMAGFALLAAGTLASYNVPQAPAALLVAPLSLVTLNLAAAIALNRRLRTGGLGLFHLALLACLLLVGAGRLTHMDGRVEVTEGLPLDPAQVEVTGAGRWNDQAWRKAQFLQGAWEVDYAPGVRRGRTRSEVWLPGEATPRTVGDDTPLVLEGYRFYTTSNKGFAPVLGWQPDGQEAILGALHMPSYPVNDGNQHNTWTSPDGRQLKFWLRIVQPLPETQAWTLAARTVPTVLVVEADGQRQELRPGEAMRLRGATLRYERLAGWMGYRIFHDRTLLPLLAIAVLGIAGLAWHLWGRTARLLPLGQEATA